MRRSIRKVLFAGLALVLSLCLALCFPDIRVRFLARLIPLCPAKFVGNSYMLDSHDSFSSAYSLADLSDSIYRSYQRRLTPSPKTYFWLAASMETQATVWQFDTYYIHLYATSDMDRDLITVGVFPGHYEKTRYSDEGVHDIDYLSPKRFFYANR